MKSLNITAGLLAIAIIAAISTRAVADPLPGEVLKFQQLPLNNGLTPTTGGAPYPGHDEWSTALTFQPGIYQGDFMADDFSDKVSTPVYHIRWWGSYDQNQSFNGVQKFLISFESDLANDPTINASRPNQPLLTQVVTNGALSPGSGTFSETFVNGGVQEHLFQYNAELALPFQEQANTVYWLKIVALVDPATEGGIKWGWHDRDWSQTNTLFSPAVVPGERVVGTVPNAAGTPVNVWHFQDDAVSGRIQAVVNSAGVLNIAQSGYAPQNYIYQLPGAIGIDGPQGIQSFSKDLAFELYTRPTPEPSTLVLLGMGVAGLGVTVWRRRRNK